MSHAATTPEDDISEQLKALVIEAASRADATPAKRSTVRQTGEEPMPPASKSEAPAWMKTVLDQIESLNSAYNESAMRLHRIEKNLSGLENLPQLLGDSRLALDQRNGVSRLMFEALHTELKGYKDAFMLEAVLRPIIRDLISLYDDMAEIHRQILASVSAQDSRGGVSGAGVYLLENIQTTGSNIGHNVHFILEVLERMEVTLLPENLDKLDKRTQRAVALEPADCEEDDQKVVKIVKRGFQSKGRVVRAEEVIIQKWKEGCLVALSDPSKPEGPQSK